MLCVLCRWQAIYDAAFRRVGGNRVCVRLTDPSAAADGGEPQLPSSFFTLVITLPSVRRLPG